MSGGENVRRIATGVSCSKHLFLAKRVLGGGKCVENDLKYVLVFRGDRGGVAYW